MGRKIRRVPLDFDWPLNKRWEGFVMPDHLMLPPCPDCRLGFAPYAQRLHDTFYPYQAGSEEAAWHDKLTQDEVDLLVEKNRLSLWVNGQPVKVPRTADEINAAQHATGILGDLHHDCVNQSILIEARCKAAGELYVCPTCGGSAQAGTPEQKAAYEAWERTGPPAGDGWQLWETVSEGSPISPVFETPEGLASWMSSSAHRQGAGWDYASALKWITGPGWAPSFIGYMAAEPQEAES